MPGATKLIAKKPYAKTKRKKTKSSQEPKQPIKTIQKEVEV